MMPANRISAHGIDVEPRYRQKNLEFCISDHCGPQFVDGGGRPDKWTKPVRGGLVQTEV